MGVPGWWELQDLLEPPSKKWGEGCQGSVNPDTYWCQWVRGRGWWGCQAGGSPSTFWGHQAEMPRVPGGEAPLPLSLLQRWIQGRRRAGSTQCWKGSLTSVLQGSCQAEGDGAHQGLARGVDHPTVPKADLEKLNLPHGWGCCAELHSLLQALPGSAPPYLRAWRAASPWPAP